MAPYELLLLGDVLLELLIELPGEALVLGDVLLELGEVAVEEEVSVVDELVVVELVVGEVDVSELVVG